MMRHTHLSQDLKLKIKFAHIMTLSCIKWMSRVRLCMKHQRKSLWNNLLVLKMSNIQIMCIRSTWFIPAANKDYFYISRLNKTFPTMDVYLDLD
jgi:hypothetical protein